jgi:hypothetical protein
MDMILVGPGSSYPLRVNVLQGIDLFAMVRGYGSSRALASLDLISAPVPRWGILEV